MTQSIDKVRSSSIRKVALASAAGTTIELYDFLIYGIASSVVLNKLFFPVGNAIVSLLASYATFGVGFLVRPIGAAVIGHFGDRVGRRPMLVLTLTMTGLCTALIGVLPSYATAGLAAPVLLLVLRLLQGFFLGGEQSGAALMVVEHAPEKRRTWYGGWTFLGSPLGLFVGTAMFSLSTAVSGGAFLSWGWRIPFLASVVLVAVGIYMRVGIEESPEFKELQSAQRVTRVPLVEVLRTAWAKVLLGVGVNIGFNAFIFVLVTFVLSYWTTVQHLPQQQVLNAGLVGGAAQVVSILIACRIADRVGRTPVMLVGAAFVIVFAFPLFWLVDTGSYGALIVAMALAYAGSGILFGPMAAYYATLFEPRLRYSGAAFSYQLGATLGGGLSPLIAVALLSVDHAKAWPISLYLVLGGVISLLCLLGLRRWAPGPAAD